MRTILETPRLVLREMSLDDLDFMADMLGDAEVTRYYPKSYTRPEAEEWVRRQMDRYASHGHAFWLALSKATGEPVGQAGLLPPRIEGCDDPDLGYMMHRPFWRQGYASEAAAGIRDYAFYTLARPRVLAFIRPENLPSQGVARKLRMQLTEQRAELGGFEHLVFSTMRDKRT